MSQESDWKAVKQWRRKLCQLKGRGPAPGRRCHAVHSPCSSAFMHAMTSWPSWNYGDIHTSPYRNSTTSIDAYTWRRILLNFTQIRFQTTEPYVLLKR